MPTSCSLGHAVLNLNRANNTRRRYILVQLPEPTGMSEFSTVADITKERMRRVSQKLAAASAGSLLDSVDDIGFRVFHLAESNFTTWDTQVTRDAHALVTQLELHV